MTLTEKVNNTSRSMFRVYYLGVRYAFYVQNSVRMHITLCYGFFNTAFAYKVHYG